ncbi:9018_t:CDS:2 [Acaulospora morrowiae]|uniref:9018_t:CDS:1 n=1 Tax=Acaulospora morrowiae TaxID=94023 RepID=A0A9N9BZT2_9GLOM|nr:9018_t:CDS:2 [Acaulospora morrowiae]
MLSGAGMILQLSFSEDTDILFYTELILEVLHVVTAMPTESPGMCYVDGKWYLNRSLEIEPDDAFALRNRGETHRMLNKYNESLSDLNRSLEIEPDDAFTLRNRGETYRMLNKYNESLSDLNRSL